MNYQDINSKVIDQWCGDGWQWGQPLIHESYLKAANSEWDVFLTLTKAVLHHWFGDLNLSEEKLRFY